MEQPKIPAAAVSAYNDTIAFGRSLMERTEAEGGWREYFDADNGLGMDDEVLAAQTAVMLENSRRWLSSLDESTLALTVGGFRDFIFPIVRASFPANPINEIVSVQPQTRKNGTIYWMNYIIGQTRGQFLRGQTLFDANNGWQGRVGYTDEKIMGEALTPTGNNAVQTGTVAELPVRPNTLEVTLTTAGGAAVLRDDGNGALIAVSNTTGQALSSGTVNYQTGAFSATFAGAITTTAASADYETNSEGQYVRSQIDLEIQSAGVTAIRRAIAMRIAMESMQDFQAEFGQDLSQQIVTAASQQILADVGGEVVRDLWDMAGTAVASFDIKVPLGINRAEHFRDINWEIQQASGAITDATQRGEATFMIVDQGAANVLVTAGAAAGFAKAADTYKGQGLVYIGDYNGLRTYKYKYMSTFPSAAAKGNILVGYKGADWWDTGYVHAPYQQFYTNGPDERADLTRRQAFAMRYAKKRINANMYKKISIIETP